MKQTLLIFSVLGIGIVQIGSAVETTYQSNNSTSENSTSSRNSYSTNSGVYLSSNEEISLAIDDLVERGRQERSQIRREQAELAKKPNVRIGMSTSQVLHNSNWGKPDDINTTINTYGKFEQWIYGGGNYLYFTNDKLTSIQY